MSDRDDDRFRIRVPSRKARDRVPAKGFVKRVLKAQMKARSGTATALSATTRQRARPGARLGRGYVAAQFAGQHLDPRSRRVVVNTHLVNLKRASPRSIGTHLRYIQRDAVGRDGERGELYGPDVDQPDAAAFEKRSLHDRHQFRLILAPEDGHALGDLKDFTRAFMRQMERDLGTRLEWVAVDHYDTDNPHTHIVLRGKDETKKDLIIAGDYITNGMRLRGAELATEWLGPRTEREIQESLNREVDQERWTSLDRDLQQRMQEGRIDFRTAAQEPTERFARTRLVARLERLEQMALAEQPERGLWTLRSDVEHTLRSMGERGDIIRTLQRAISEEREYSIFAASEGPSPVTGQIVDKGLADELDDRGFLIIDGTDGRLHHVTLASSVDLSDLPTGAIVTARGAAQPRAVDRAIAEVAEHGIYRTSRHLEIAERTARSGQDPQSYVQAHVRRLEALRKAGIVERIADGVWTVPADLIARAQADDARRIDGAQVEVQSYLPIDQQKRAIGATWLDRQLLAGESHLSLKGFGATAREALAERVDFLVDQGLAKRRNQHVILARNLLTTLRSRDIEQAASSIAAQTGLPHYPTIDGQRVSGIYQRSITLASGRFAMLENGMGFSLVPWRPVIDQRLGQTIAATVRGDYVSWDIGRQLGLSR